MKTIMYLSIALVLLSLCGCSQYWYQETKTFDECSSDRQDCFNELSKRTDFGNVTAEYEVKFMEECMAKKGYQAVEQDKLPIDVKRQEPQTSFHWRAKGIAGKLSE